MVELPVGERHALSLPGMGSAGYQWTADVRGGGAVAEVDMIASEPVTDAIGAGVDEKFEIRAKEPGEAVVRFEQRRPWERGDEPPVGEHVVRVRVI